MANSPSKKYDDNGVLVERAIASDVAGDADEQEAVTGRPADVAPGNTTLAERAKARQGSSKKAVSSDDAENKAVSRASTKSKK